MDRAFEREILPMAREHGMALSPWHVLAGGKLRSDAEEARREKSGENGRDIGIDSARATDFMWTTSSIRMARCSCFSA